MISTQFSDASSMYSGYSGDITPTPAPTLETPTLQESTLIAMTAPDNGYLDKLVGQRSQVLDYTVQEGDLLSFIASDYGVSVDSILWANGIKDADSISPGQVLHIPPVDGVIYNVQKGDTAASLAKKYKSDADHIIAYNHLPLDGSLTVGTQIVIPGGVVTAITKAAVVGVARAAVRIGTATPLSQAAMDTPDAPEYGTASAKKLAQYANLFSHLPDLGDYFMAPATGFDWGLLHGRNGVDLANSCGTPIVAAADGTVTIADASGYNGGFGKYIKISHPNGTETLYAHASKLLVVVGQAVSKGDKIALMGATSYATGCHVHFEVHGAQNPLAKE